MGSFTGKQSILLPVDSCDHWAQSAVYEQGSWELGMGTEGELGVPWVPKIELEGKEEYNDQTPLVLK